MRLNCFKLWLNIPSQILTQWVHATVFPATTENSHGPDQESNAHTVSQRLPEERERVRKQENRKTKMGYINNTGQNESLSTVLYPPRNWSLSSPDQPKTTEHKSIKQLLIAFLFYKEGVACSYLSPEVACCRGDLRQSQTACIILATNNSPSYRMFLISILSAHLLLHSPFQAESLLLTYSLPCTLSMKEEVRNARSAVERLSHRESECTGSWQVTVSAFAQSL